MYVPPKFAVDVEAAWDVVREAGAGMLVLAGRDGLASVFVPVLISEDRTRLRAHLAKANPWWDAADEGAEVLGLFVTASAYVTPTWYPTREENPGAVPTWNYVAAEVRGRLHRHPEVEWMREQVTDLTDHFEEGLDPRWWVSDAPAHYIDQQLKAIVGVEIEVLSIEGKAKLSQNRPEVDHDSVRDHLAEGSPAERNVARRMGRG